MSRGLSPAGYREAPTFRGTGCKISPTATGNTLQLNGLWNLHQFSTSPPRLLYVGKYVHLVEVSSRANLSMNITIDGPPCTQSRDGLISYYCCSWPSIFSQNSSGGRGIIWRWRLRRTAAAAAAAVGYWTPGIHESSLCRRRPSSEKKQRERGDK